MLISLSILVCLLVLWVQCVVFNMESSVVMMLEFTAGFGSTYKIVIKLFFILTFLITILGLLTPFKFYTKSGKTFYPTWAYFFLAFSLFICYIIFTLLHLLLWMKAAKVTRRLDVGKALKLKSSSEQFSKLIDRVQIEHKCCGIEGPEDWFTNRWWKDSILNCYHYKVPTSCCSKNHCIYAAKALEDLTVYHGGCRKSIEKVLTNLFLLNWTMGLLILLLQIIVLFVLFLELRKGSNENKGIDSDLSSLFKNRFKKRKEIQEKSLGDQYDLLESGAGKVQILEKTNSHISFQNDSVTLSKSDSKDFQHFSTSFSDSSPKKLKKQLTESYLNHFPTNFTTNLLQSFSGGEKYTKIPYEKSNSSVKVAIGFEHPQEQTSGSFDIDTNPSLNSQHRLDWLEKNRVQFDAINEKLNNETIPLAYETLRELDLSSSLDSKQHSRLLRQTDQVLRTLNNPLIEKTPNIAKLMERMIRNKQQLEISGASHHSVVTVSSSFHPSITASVPNKTL